MATSLGALVALDYHFAGAFLLFFAGGFALLRKTVLPGLIAFACLPALCLYLDPNPARSFGISVLAILIVFAHRKNLFEEVVHLLERRHLRQQLHHHHQPK
jgi:glycerol-3-phosphate acyltransferase PlsY